jgi:hypothetical protein
MVIIDEKMIERTNKDNTIQVCVTILNLCLFLFYIFFTRLMRRNHKVKQSKNDANHAKDDGENASGVHFVGYLGRVLTFQVNVMRTFKYEKDATQKQNYHGQTVENPLEIHGQCSRLYYNYLRLFSMSKIFSTGQNLSNLMKN